MRLIECRGCNSPYCDGCNLHTLSQMLHGGKLDRLMDEQHSIIPDIEAIPVVHGRWVEKTDSILETYYDCSVCRESFYLAEGVPFDNLYRYCPNCGAHMKDGGTEQ